LLENPNWWKDPEENIGTIVHRSPEDLNIVVGTAPHKKDGHYDE
jgi:hypothetical protein